MSASRAGLARYRPLTANESKKPPNSQGLPDGWFYNEPKEKDFWKNVEGDFKPTLDPTKDESTMLEENVSQLKETSTRINSIVDKLDNIDQEVLFELQKLTTDEDHPEGEDPSLILNDSKNSVLTYMTDIKNYTETQLSMLETLKSSFHALQSNGAILSDEGNHQQSSLPNVDKVFSDIDILISQNIEKTEKAIASHNQITSYWQNRVSFLRTAVSERDAKISILTSNIEAAAVSKAKRHQKKKQAEIESQSQSQVQVQPVQSEAQLRIVEEQKATIDKLKKQLELNEAAFHTYRQPSSDRLRAALSEKESDLAGEKLENEAKFARLNEQIFNLQKEVQAAKDSADDSRDKMFKSLEKCTQMETENKQLDATIQKYIKLLSLEKSKPPPPPPPAPDTSMNEDHYLMLIKNQEAIRDLQDKHRAEMLKQAETLRQHYEEEKKKILAAIDTPDAQAFLQTVVTEYERKLAQQKKDCDDMTEKLVRNWGAKVSALTRQFENRIRSMNTAHEVELISCRDSVKYEVGKARIQFEEENSKSLLCIQRECSNKVTDLQEKVAKLESELSKNDEEEEKDEKAKKDTEESNYFEVKYQNMKRELEEQHEWEMKEQKIFYENKLAGAEEERQKSTKKLLLKIEESLSKVVNEGETTMTIADALDTVSNAYTEINEVEENKEENPTVSLAEAQTREKSLTEKVIQLNNEIVQKNKEQKDAENESRKKILEAAKGGNSAEIISQIEQSFQKEIDEKDTVIQKLQDTIELKNQVNFKFEYEEIFKYNEKLNMNFQAEKQNTEVQAAGIVPRIFTAKGNALSGRKEALTDRPMKYSKDFNTGRRMKADEQIQKEEAQIQKKMTQLFESDPQGIDLIYRSSKQSGRQGSGSQNGDTQVTERNLTDVQVSISKSDEAKNNNEVTSQSDNATKSPLEPQENYSSSHHEGSTIEPKIGSPLEPEISSPLKSQNESQGEVEKGEKITIEKKIELKISEPLVSQRFYKSISSLSKSLAKESITIAPRRRKSYKVSERLVLFSSLPKNQTNAQKKDTYTPPVMSSFSVKPVESKAFVIIGPPSFFEIVDAIQQEKMFLSIENLIEKSIPFRFFDNIIHVARTEPIGDKSIQAFSPIYIEPLQKTRLQVGPDQTELNNFYDLYSSFLIDEMPFTNDNKEFETKLLQLVSKDEVINLQQKEIMDLKRRLVQLEAALRSAQNHARAMMAKDSNTNTKKMVEEAKPKEAPKQIELSKSLETSNAVEVSDPLIYSPSKEEVPIPKFTPTENIKEDEDPFTTSIQQMASVMRSFLEFQENENNLSNSLKGDCIAYESFLAASSSTDPSQKSFLEQVKQIAEYFSTNVGHIEEIIKQCHILLSLVRQSKKRAELIATQNSDLQAQHANQQLTAQQATLKQILSEKSEGDQVKQLVVLHKMESALEVIDQLGISLSQDDQQKYRTLNRKVKELESTASSSKGVNQATIGQTLSSIQSFINGIKPNLHQPTLLSENPDETGHMKHKVKKLEKEKEGLEKSLQELQQRLESYANQISVLKGRLDQEKEVAEGTVTLYQAQISMLRDLLGQLTERSDNKNQSASDLVGAVRDEVLSLQSLLETSRAERDSFKSKAADLEDRIMTKDQEVNNLNSAMEGLRNENENIEKKMRKNVEVVLFHDSDMNKIKMERAVEQEAQMQGRQKLEEVIGENQSLSTQLEDRDKKIANLKKDIQQLDDQINDLTMKLSFGHYKRINVPQQSEATQTTFKLVLKHRSQKRVDGGAEENAENDEEAKIPTNEKLAESNISQTGAKPQATNLQIDDKGSASSTPSDTIAPIAFSTASSRTESTVSLLNLSETSSMFSSQVQWIDDESEKDKDQDNFTDTIHPSARHTTRKEILEIGDQAVGNVHAPLAFPHKKPRLDEQTAKTRRPITTYNKIRSPNESSANYDDLYIGREPVQPQPFEPKKIHPNLTPPSKLQKAHHPLSVLGPIESIHFNFPSTTPGSPTMKRSEVPSPTFSPNPEETVRITRVQYIEPPHQLPKAPTVKPIQREEAADPYLPPRTPSRPPPGPDLSEIHKLVTKLREQVSGLQSSNESKDAIISGLKKKLSEYLRENQRTFVEKLRAEDSAKKATIRYENVQERLDVSMKELGSRLDEIDSLKRDLFRLRTAAGPAEASLGRIKSAQIEQKLLKREAEKTKTIYTTAMKLLDKTVDDAAKKHLGALISNTQKSLARIETKRVMWAAVERKQIMGSLAALSLIETKAVSLIHKLPDYSPFFVRRKLVSSGRNEEEEDRVDQTLTVGNKV